MTPNLKELAKVGAQERLAEIQQEQTALLAMFPELREGRGKKTASTASAIKTGRKRRTMSAAQRKAVGERMKGYWAAKRAEKANVAGDGAQAEMARQNGEPSRKAGPKAGRRQGRKK